MSEANRTTEFVYTLENRLAMLIARNGATGDQVTRWHYGTTLAESGVASNSLVRAKVYPESDDAGPGLNGPDTVYDRVEFRYNRRGEVVQQKDQNGTVHEYRYDRLGRLVDDAVPTLGTGIDSAVRRISRGYDRAGRIESVGSWSAPVAGAGSVINEVRMRYNGFGQLTEEYQSHDGQVWTGTTPAVRYTYADGSNRHIRRLSTVYPGGQEIGLYYGTSGSADDKLGRVEEIQDASEGDAPLARYTRRGLSATMRIEYPQAGATNPLEMTYIKLPGEPDGDAGDQYTGQDRFNRTIDIRWRRGETTTHVDRIQYGFDRAGNRLWRKNVVAADNWDELYSYDGLYQLPERQRGTLNSGRTALTATPLDQEQFSYDPTGNWDAYVTQASGSTTLDQSRTHNRANEITAVDGSELTVAYDRAGNMTRMPKVGDWPVGQELTWDAWNRLVKISEGEEIIGTYAYDGMTRRVWKESVEEGGVTPTRRHFYYSDQWQVLEERLDSSAEADRRFVWGLRYIDDLVLRDRIDGSTTERLYATHDQWHVIATVDEDAAATERFAYRAFGETQVLAPNFDPRSASISGWETTYGAYRYDAESDLYAVRFRYLQSALGRWLSRDPIGESGGPNLQEYVANAPITSVDIYGLQAPGNPPRFFDRLQNIPELNKCLVGDGNVPPRSPGTESEGAKDRNCISAAMGIKGQQVQIPHPTNADGTPKQDMTPPEFVEHVEDYFSKNHKNCRKVKCKTVSLAKGQGGKQWFGALFYTPCEKCEREVVLAVYVHPDGGWDVHAAGRDIDCNEFKSTPFESVKGARGSDITNITDIPGHFAKYCSNIQKHLCYCCKKPS